MNKKHLQTIFFCDIIDNVDLYKMFVVVAQQDRAAAS